MKKNALYAQSGGVTAVINATAGALILEAKKSNKIGKVFAAKNGILGALREDLIDTSKESNNSLLSSGIPGRLLTTTSKTFSTGS